MTNSNIKVIDKDIVQDRSVNKDPDKNNTNSSGDIKQNKWEQRKSMVPSTPISIDAIAKKWFISSYRCDLTQLKKLLQNNIQLINTRDFATGFAAIHWAAKKGRNDVIAWLSANNADINIQTYGGYSPLHIATMHNNEDVMNKLITQFNADVNIRDNSGRKPGFYHQDTTPLQMAKTEDVGPSGRHLFTPFPDVGRTLSTSLTMPDIEKEFPTVNTTPKKKRRGISLSHSFKGKHKFLVLQRIGRNGEDKSSSASDSRHVGWRKSLSVPDITIASEPLVMFEQEI